MKHATIEVAQIRNATLVVGLGGKRFVVDPAFDPAGSRPAVVNTANDRRNPLVELPVPAESISAEVEAAFVTHLHADHFDDTAAALLAKHLPLFCLPEHVEALRDRGFADVTPVQDGIEWEGITVTRTAGRHGTGEIGERMAPVCGFVFRTASCSLYVAGDTIWCEEVAEALHAHTPDIVVVNAGEARFRKGDPITMSADDVIEVCRAAPKSVVVASHCEAINHCGLSRRALDEAAAKAAVKLEVPEDGETVCLCATEVSADPLRSAAR